MQSPKSSMVAQGGTGLSGWNWHVFFALAAHSAPGLDHITVKRLSEQGL